MLQAYFSSRDHGLDPLRAWSRDEACALHLFVCGRRDSWGDDTAARSPVNWWGGRNLVRSRLGYTGCRRRRRLCTGGLELHGEWGCEDELCKEER